MAAFKPMHPGEILREEFLKPLDLSAGELAKICNVPRSRIERIVDETTSITGDTAIRLSKAFGNSAEFWLNLQKQYELEIALQQAEGNATIASIKKIEQVAA